MAINPKLLNKNEFLIKQINKLNIKRAEKTAKDAIKYLNPNDKIIDIGSGNCNVCDLLIKDSFDVTPVDVKNLSLVENIKPIIYDGKTLPFQDNQFDVALILFVLHHCQNPEEIIMEATRVSKRIIIMEDIYTSKPHKFLTCVLDSALNQEFIEHPHSNKKDSDWKMIFKQFGLNVILSKYENWHLIMRHATYYLQK